LPAIVRRAVVFDADGDSHIYPDGAWHHISNVSNVCDCANVRNVRNVVPGTGFIGSAGQ
jgi:hypothetical protein